jgi:deoxyadenosine/deoxycytidine kinase
MKEISFPLLVVSGPIGVGKTTVAQEISNLLDRSNTAHTFVDLDALTQTYTRPPDDPYGYRLVFANL